MAAKKTATRRIIDDVLLSRVAVDDEHVYASSEYGDSKLIAVAHDGSQRRDLVRDIPISHVAAARDGLYATSGSRFVRIDKASGGVDIIADIGATPWGFAIDDEHVYGSILGTDGGIVRVPKRGGDLGWLVRGKSVTAFAVDRDSILYASGGQLWRGDTPIVDVRNPHVIAVVGDAIVWTEFDNHGSLAMFHNGARRDLAPGGYTSGLVAIGDWIYWTLSQRKKTGVTVWRMKLDGEPQPLAKFTSKAAPLAGNEQIVCWHDDCAGGVGATDPRMIPAAEPAGG